MPTPTYVPLATTTLSSTSSLVTFSSIPNTYRDLNLVVDGNTSNGSGAWIRFNNDSSSSYQIMFLFGQGASALTESYASTTEIGIGAFQNSGLIIHEILDYSATSHQKMVFVKRATPSYITVGAGRWANNQAIHTITFGATNMLAGTTLSLYGIAG